MQYKHGFVYSVRKVTQLSFVSKESSVLTAEIGTNVFVSI